MSDHCNRSSIQESDTPENRRILFSCPVSGELKKFFKDPLDIIRDLRAVLISHEPHPVVRARLAGLIHLRYGFRILTRGRLIQGYRIFIRGSHLRSFGICESGVLASSGIPVPVIPLLYRFSVSVSVRLEPVKLQNQGDFFLLILLRHNFIYEAMFQLELRPLKSLWNLLTDGLFDHPRPCEPDQCTRLCQRNISQARIARAHTSGSRIRQHRYIQSSVLTQPFHRGTRLRHLHQGNHSLLHSRPAARRKNNQWKFSSVCFFDRNRQFFSLSTSHAAHHEISAEFCTDRRNSVDPPDSRDTSLRFLRDFPVLLKLPAIPGKTQRIVCLQIRRKLF